LETIPRMDRPRNKKPRNLETREAKKMEIILVAFFGACVTYLLAGGAVL